MARMSVPRDMFRESAMSGRKLKIAALMLSGGVVLQLGGCASLLVQQLLTTIVSGAISTLIQGILNTGTAAT